MNTGIQAFTLFVLCALAGGCAAPGSGISRLRVSGRLLDSSGSPVCKQQVDVLLPSPYGLSGLDPKWGKPEDYGHRDQGAAVATDETGRFEHAFSPTTYSTAFWIIPPLGPIPRKPPPPYFYLKLPAQTNEFWVLWMKKTGLETKVIERGNRTPLDQSHVVPAAFSGKLIWEGEVSSPGYLVDFEMKVLKEADKSGSDQASEAIGAPSAPQL